MARQLQAKWETGVLLITLGERGLWLFEGDNPPFHTAARAKEVFDVSGAGDTVIALFTLALASGARLARRQRLGVVGRRDYQSGSA